MEREAAGEGRAEEDAPTDLFEDEEHPVTIVLCLLPEYDGRDLVELLERRGIGARLGEASEDSVEVLIHEFRLPEAQSILVEFTGDPSVLDDVTEGDAWDETNDRGLGTEGDPGSAVNRQDQAIVDDDYALVSSGLPANADGDARRLEAEGIEVRVRMPAPDEDRAVADVLVHRDNLARAREILGIIL
jgi:hypothetical protein